MIRIDLHLITDAYDHRSIQTDTFALGVLNLLRCHVGRYALRRRVDQHQHGPKGKSHQAESNAEPNEWTCLDLCVHAIRDRLTYSFKTTECRTVTNVCCTGLASVGSIHCEVAYLVHQLRMKTAASTCTTETVGPSFVRRNKAETSVGRARRPSRSCQGHGY